MTRTRDNIHAVLIAHDVFLDGGGEGIHSDGEWAWLRCPCGWSQNFEMPEDDIKHAHEAAWGHVADVLGKELANAASNPDNVTVTLTETERDDLCDAMVDYTSNRAAAAPARFDRHVVPTVERIIAARVAEAHRDDATVWDLVLSELEELATRWEREANRNRVPARGAPLTYASLPPLTPAEVTLLGTARALRAVLRGAS